MTESLLLPSKLSRNLPCLHFIPMDKLQSILKESHSENSFVRLSAISFTLFQNQISSIIQYIESFLINQEFSITSSEFNNFNNNDNTIKLNESNKSQISLEQEGIYICNKVIVLKHFIHTILSESSLFSSSESKISKDEFISEKNENIFLKLVEKFIMVIIFFNKNRNSINTDDKLHSLWSTLQIVFIDILIVCFSTHLYCDIQFINTNKKEIINTNQNHLFLNTLQYFKEDLALEFILILINNFIEYRLSLNISSPIEKVTRNSNAILYIYDIYQTIKQKLIDKSNSNNFELNDLSVLLGSHSILLLLIIIVHRKKDTNFFNPFLLVFRKLENFRNETIENIESPVQDNFTLSFDSLLKVISLDFELEEHSLFLYLLLMENIHFYSYISNLNVKNIVLLLLFKLYSYDNTYNLISSQFEEIILILNLLSQNEFVHFYHILQSNEISWFKDLRISGDIYLSNFSTQILINLSKKIYKLIDKLQSNLIRKSFFLIEYSLFAIGNMNFGYDVIMDTNTSQLLVSLLIMFYKSYQRYENSILTQDTEILFHYLRNSISILLDIICNVLLFNSKSRLDLVYHLLQQKAIIDKIEQSFHDRHSIQKIKQILEYFYHSIDNKSNNKFNNLEQEVKDLKTRFHSTSDVMILLQKADKLLFETVTQDCNPITFHFVETNPEPFLISRIWNIIIESIDSVKWNLKSMKLPLSFTFYE